MIDFLYHGANYSYDSYGCVDDDYEDDYCRCAVYDNVVVSEVNLERVVQHILNRNIAFNAELTNFAKSLGLDNTESYVVRVVNGYYGEEIEGIHLRREVDVVSKLQSYVHHNSVGLDLDGITTYLDGKGYDSSSDDTVNSAVRKSLLIENNTNSEPQYVLSTSQAFVKRISFRDIFIPNEHHYAQVSARDVPKDNPIYGVVVQSGSQYRLIDGYHRVKGARKASGNFIVLT